jgi:hypothetical protein
MEAGLSLSAAISAGWVAAVSFSQSLEKKGCRPPTRRLIFQANGGTLSLEFG